VQRPVLAPQWHAASGAAAESLTSVDSGHLKVSHYGRRRSIKGEGVCSGKAVKEPLGRRGACGVRPSHGKMGNR
jgi:hypothetical protein